MNRPNPPAPKMRGRDVPETRQDAIAGGRAIGLDTQALVRFWTARVASEWVILHDAEIGNYFVSSHLHNDMTCEILIYFARYSDIFLTHVLKHHILVYFPASILTCILTLILTSIPTSILTCILPLSLTCLLAHCSEMSPYI